MEPGSGVTVYDVGPRDGLQNEPDVLEPSVRAELVQRLVGAGVRAVEVASFVDPRRVPQMAGAEDVVAALEHTQGVAYAGLALNERGSIAWLRQVSTKCGSRSASRNRSTSAIRAPRWTNR